MPNDTTDHLFDDPERWRRVKEIVADALELPAPERDAYLVDACQRDARLLAEVRSMIHADHEDFLATPAASDLGLVGADIGLKPGDEVGPYRVGEEIGEGGFGVVYLAEQHAPLRRTVALKVLKPGMDTRQVIARFEAERQTLAAMNHPGIASIFDAGATARGLPYFVMELIEGEPILRYCDSRAISLAGRLELFAQVCDAIAHAHRKGVIHRDLKSSNVLVHEENGVARATVIDFGIAKAAGPQQDGLTLLTAAGEFVGTPQAMSPEQIGMDDSDVDTRTDVYSLGVLLYELLCGYPPLMFGRMSSAFADDLRRQICEIDPPLPSARLSGSGGGQPAERADMEEVARCRRLDRATLQRRLRGDLDWIVMKALEKNRERRYESVTSLAEDLRRYRSSEPVLAGPPSRVYRLRKVIIRHRALVTSATLIAFALIVGLVLAVTGLRTARIEARQARTAERNERTAKTEALEAQQEAESVTRFLEYTLRSVEPGELGQDVTVLDVLNEVQGTLDELGSAELEQRLRNVFGNTYQHLGEFELAQQHLEKSLQIARGEFGPDDPRALAAEVEIMHLRYSQSRSQEAMAELDDLIGRCVRILGAEHERTLAVRKFKAEFLVDLGQGAEAIELYREVLPATERVFGTTSSQVTSLLGNLAQTYAFAGEFELAEATLEDAIQRAERDGEASVIQAMALRQALAMVYFNSRRFQEGIDLLVPLVQQSVEVFGADHYQTLGRMIQLATVYQRNGQLDSAEPIFQRCLEPLERTMGPGHRMTLMCMHNLAMVQDAFGRDSQAEELLSETLRRQIESRGDDQWETHTTRYHLATVHQKQGRLEEARELFRVAASGLVRELSPKHTLVQEVLVDYRRYLDQYADELLEGEYYLAAEELLMEALEALGDQATELAAHVCERLAEVAERREDPEEARSWRERADRLRAGER